MAGFFTILQSQDFTSTDSITVTHGLNRAQVAIAVRVGDELRNDLIEKVQPGSADPRNEVVVTLTSAQSGAILLLGTDYIFSNTPAPEEAAIISTAIHTDVAGEVDGIAEKTNPMPSDLLLIEDASDSNNKKKLEIGNLPGGGGGQSNTGSNVGTAGVGPFDAKVGVDLQFKNINAGSSKISVTDDVADKEIDIDVVEGNVIHQNLSGAGTNTHAQIDSHISDTANPHATDVGNIGSGTLAELNTAITDATLDDAGDSRTPSGSAGGDLGGTYPSPTVNDGADGTAIHDDTSGEISAVALKGTPVSADMLLIEDSADSNSKKRITVGSLPTGGGGESNTASNVGTAGVGVFKQKTGVDLEFKKVNAGSTKVSVTDDTGNDEIDIDVVESNVVHQNLSGSGTNTHAQIDTHIADTANPHATDVGNLGSGTLAELNIAITDATLDDSGDSRPPSGSAGGDLGGTYPSPTVNDGADGTAIHDDTSGEISVVAEKTTPVNADLLLIEDSAAGNAKKRVQIGNLPGGGGAVFGQDYSRVEDTAQDTTTSNSFQDKLTMTTGVLTGTYRVSWSAVIGQSNTQDKCEARLRNTTDSVTVGNQNASGIRIEPKDSANRYPVGGWDLVVFSGAAKTFVIQWREQDGNTARIEDARIEIWRIS